MASQAFTRNYRDHSNDMGFQFEFFCDKCGNGFRSSYKTSAVGFLGSMVKAATNILGSGARLGTGADQLKDALRGPAWDGAFAAAIGEIRPKFHQCTRCGQWVCPDVCWNGKRQLCEGCAPNLQEEAGAIQAQVAIEQARAQAAKHDQTGGLDLGVAQAAACPKCQASLEPGVKFCTGCGQDLGAGAPAFCGQCGAALAPGARFCGGCGTKR
jgi:hypothetical protein